MIRGVSTGITPPPPKCLWCENIVYNCRLASVSPPHPFRHRQVAKGGGVIRVLTPLISYSEKRCKFSPKRPTETTS